MSKSTPPHDRTPVAIPVRRVTLLASILVVGFIVLAVTLHKDGPPQNATLTLNPGTHVPSGLLNRNWFHDPSYRYDGTSEDGTTLYFTDTQRDERLATTDQRAGNTFSLPELRTDLSATIVTIDEESGALTLRIKSW